MVNALSRIVNERRANPPKGCSGVLEAQSLWKFKPVTQMQTTCKKSKTFRAKKKSGGRVDMQVKVLKPMERWKLLNWLKVVHLVAFLIVQPTFQNFSCSFKQPTCTSTTWCASERSMIPSDASRRGLATLVQPDQAPGLAPGTPPRTDSVACRWGGGSIDCVRSLNLALKVL